MILAFSDMMPTSATPHLMHVALSHASAVRLETSAD